MTRFPESWKSVKFANPTMDYLEHHIFIKPAKYWGKYSQCILRNRVSLWLLFCQESGPFRILWVMRIIIILRVSPKFLLGRITKFIIQELSWNGFQLLYHLWIHLHRQPCLQKPHRVAGRRPIDLSRATRRMGTNAPPWTRQHNRMPPERARACAQARRQGTSLACCTKTYPKLSKSF